MLYICTVHVKEHKMTKKLLGLVLLLFVLSCKQNDENTIANNNEPNHNEKLTAKDISKLKYLDFGVDDKVQPLIESWNEYTQLEDLILNVKNANLSYFKNDAKKNLQTLLKDLKEHMPDTINTPSVIARISVLETKLYKTESLSNLSTTKKEELANTIKELLVSFSNLNFQMNKKLEKDSQNIQKPI